MNVFDDWDGLTSAAQNACTEILRKNVAPVMKAIIKRHIQSDIYDAYTPVPNGWVGGETYQRRHVLEGAMYQEIQGRGKDTVMVTSTAPASKSVVPGYSFHNRRPGAFLSMLESGNTGIWRNGFPRPVISNAQREIDKSGEIESAINSGITKYFG